MLPDSFIPLILFEQLGYNVIEPIPTLNGYGCSGFLGDLIVLAVNADNIAYVLAVYINLVASQTNALKHCTPLHEPLFIITTVEEWTPFDLETTHRANMILFDADDGVPNVRL